MALIGNCQKGSSLMAKKESEKNASNQIKNR